MKHIRVILREMMQEENKRIIQALETERLNIKLSLIDDYFKARKLLAAWNIPDHLEVLTNRVGEIFDQVFDLDIESLENEVSLLQAAISGHAYRIHGIRGKKG